MELLWAGVCFVAAVSLHALLTRWPRSSSIVKFLVAGGLGGLGLTVYLLCESGPTLATFAGIASYAFACELYLFLFTMVGGSISARLLMLMRDGGMSSSEIEVVYDTKEMVERRLDRLLMAGLVEPVGGGYRLSRKGQRLTRVATSLKRFFRHE
jgi:hypothetical protein